ncbi:MAG: (2Fe-2S) ferredoxin domain-containing protein [Cyanobacteria bacterium]|nr:(2Fe-2S) ferredoxin domain-containing protein [Cyanobacteriota bacterium]
MQTTQPAPQPPVSHHLLLCATPSKALCCPDPQVGAASWATLKRLVRELGLEDPGRTGGVVWRTKADCLRICGGGPILLIWPDGITYGGVSSERIERILRQHVIGGQPVSEWIVQRTAFSGQAPDPQPRLQELPVQPPPGQSLQL